MYRLGKNNIIYYLMLLLFYLFIFVAHLLLLTCSWLIVERFVVERGKLF
jgi:hypothetical protein